MQVIKKREIAFFLVALNSWRQRKWGLSWVWRIGKISKVCDFCLCHFYEDPSIYKNIFIWTPNAQVLRKTRMYGRKGLEISKLSYNNCFAISRLSVWLLNNSLTSSNFCSLIWKMRNPNLMIFKAFSSSFEFCMQSIVVKSTEMMLCAPDQPFLISD